MCRIKQCRANCIYSLVSVQQPIELGQALPILIKINRIAVGDVFGIRSKSYNPYIDAVFDIGFDYRGRSGRAGSGTAKSVAQRLNRS